MKLTEVEFVRLTEESEAKITAKVICDSVNPDGTRLTTMEWTYPRFIHSEIMTHRQFSKNSASSRAIPMAKMIERVRACPVFPLHWGKNQKGMQASEELDLEQKLTAGYSWILARDEAIEHAEALNNIGIHKQLGNRLVEPWMWITIIISGTNWENLFALRCHKDAEPHFQNLAYKARDAYDASKPRGLDWGEWHLPFVFGYEPIPELDAGAMLKEYVEYHDNLKKFAKASAGRCARVSYLTHDGKRDLVKDVELCDNLATHKPMHASPLEHPAEATKPDGDDHDWGNYDPGWLQLRKTYHNECVRTRQLA